MQTTQEDYGQLKQLSIDLAWLVCGELLCGKSNQGVWRSRVVPMRLGHPEPPCLFFYFYFYFFFGRWMADWNENSPTDRRLEILRSCGGQTLFLEQAWLSGDDNRC